MKPVIDLSKEYGIVLEGGGAKGAYQIGAWKALREAGVKIKGIAGTSVGALNGALMCMDDIDNAQEIWKNISYSRIMDVDDMKMRQLFQGELSLHEAVLAGISYATTGGVDVTPLKALIAEYIDEEKVRNSPIEFYIHTFSVDEMKDLDIDVKDVEPDRIKDFLLASAYIFPIFKNEKLHGKTYIDGGAINNVPLDSLVKRDYKDIIMIRIYGIGREKNVKIPEGTCIYNIAPRVQLGNIIDFDANKSKRNMTIGYYDAKRFLFGLKGNIYYIEESKEECYYLRQLVSISAEVKYYLMEQYHLKQEADLYDRHLLETIIPAVASELKLGNDWNYKTLYLAMLEATAKLCRVKKYHIYQVEELLYLVRDRVAVLGTKEKLPTFAYIIGDRVIEH